MNPEAEAKLKELLDKTPEELTIEEKGFIQARRGYLDKRDKENFEEILTPEAIEENNKAIREAVANDETRDVVDKTYPPKEKETAEDEGKDDEENEPSYKELKARAQELGMKNPTGKSKKDLTDFIEKAEADENGKKSNDQSKSN